MKFNPLVENSDLSIHSDPPDWNVGVICRWKDAHRFRSRYPNVSVVGPLRTVRGIDLLFRSLLANPQIQCVLVDGVDLTPGQATTEALIRTWRGSDEFLGPDVIPHANAVRHGVKFSFDREFRPPRRSDAFLMDDAVILPPPSFDSSSLAPHGDPGQSICGDTLDELWPRALQQAMRFGRLVPTQYGQTREVLNLVSVVRDPGSARTLSAWIPGWDQVDVYSDRLFRDVEPPDGAKYSYSSRFHGQASGRQLELLDSMLTSNPGARAAFVTPWDPSVDAGIESGRPCLVGAWFRQVDGCLHMTIMFRSHDLFGAYPLNLASSASWLCHMATRHGLNVGTLTCVSCSAHVYDRDYSISNDVIHTHLPKQIDWDPRSTWNVTLSGSTLRAEALSPDGSVVLEVFEGRTVEGVRSKIERSGLIQSIGNALWLGDELRRVAGSK